MKQLLITLLLFMALISACKAQTQTGVPGGGTETLADCYIRAIKECGNRIVACETSTCIKAAYGIFVLDLKMCRLIHADPIGGQTNVIPLPCQVIAVDKVLYDLEACTTKSCVQQYLKQINEDIAKCK